MSWASPPERPDAVPAATAPVPTTWAPRGPAVVRTLAATVLCPGALVAVAALDPPQLGEETLSNGSTTGYWVGAAVALGALALLLWALVAQARTRPPTPAKRSPGDGALIGAVLVFGASVLYLVLVVLAIVVFLGAAVLLAPAGVVAVPCAIGALLGLLNARGGHTGPTQLTATCAAVAGWLVAVVGMPVAGGVFVLTLAGG